MGSVRGTAMNVATIPELFTHEKEEEREKGVIRKKERLTPQHERIFLRHENAARKILKNENAASSQHR